MKILIHACCAPCLIFPLKRLTEKGHKLTGFWYNPNIHPYTEYRNRLEATRYFEGLNMLPMIYHDQYDLEDFLKMVISDLNNRCEKCYHMRLLRTAEVAKSEGLDRFTTTLLVSPYQDHKLINDIGEKIGQKMGIEFFYEDFRPGYYEGQNQAKELGLYRQKYCGCIFSEKERYLSKE